MKSFLEVKSTWTGLELLKSWPKRAEHILPMIPYQSAQHLAAFIRQRLPKGSAYHAYRKGLEVARVKGTAKGEYAYVVHINLKDSTVRKVRPNYVLLYVRPKRSASKPDPATKVLEKYNPWTFDTLPFTPNPKFGLVQKKKSRPAEVMRVSTKRKKERPTWSRELTKAGHRDIHKGNRLKFPKKSHVLPSMALEVMKLEFGLGGAKPRPAWRLGASRTARSELRRILKNPKYFVFPLTRLSDKMWSKWPPRTKHSISRMQALKYREFERKLGFRKQG